MYSKGLIKLNYLEGTHRYRQFQGLAVTKMFQATDLLQIKCSFQPQYSKAEGSGNYSYHWPTQAYHPFALKSYDIVVD